MFYINKKGDRFPENIYNELSDDKKLGFISIPDEEYYQLLEQSNAENKEFALQGDVVTLKERELTQTQRLENEKSSLKSFVSSADYITLKLYRASLQGQNLLDEYSDTFQMTNREVLQKVDEAIARINEINSLLLT